MKKILCCFLLSLFVSSTVFASPLNGTYENKPIVLVNVDGRVIQPEVPAYIDGGSTMLPLRAVSEALGAEVTWNQDTYVASVKTRTQVTAGLSQESIDRISRSVAKIYVYDANEKPIAQGTGFIIDDGRQGKTVVTNYHVGSAGPIMRVEVNGQVIGIRNQVLFQNQLTDVWGVKIDTTAPSIPYVTALPQVGERVTAIGYPKALYKVSTGEVERIYNTWGDATVTTISTSANIDSGSSGGVLLNIHGEIIGITTVSISNNTDSTSIPAKYIQQELDKLK